MIKVLLVDDEPFILEGLSRVINWESEGFQVVQKCTSPLAALDFIKTTPVDLVIADIRMPEMTGLELLEKVRKELKKDTWFIILSGYNDFSYARTAMQYQCLDYLCKPINTQELLDALKKARTLDAQKQQEEEKDSRYQQESFTRNIIPLLYGQYDAANIQSVTSQVGNCPNCRYVSIELNTASPACANLSDSQKLAHLKKLYDTVAAIFPQDTLRILNRMFVSTGSYDIGIVLNSDMICRSTLENPDTGAMDEALFLKKLREHLLNTSDIPLFFFVGNVAESIETINKSVRSITVSRSISNMDALTQHTPDDSSLNLEENRIAKSEADALITAVEQNNKAEITESARHLLNSMERAEFANANLLISYIFYRLMHLAYELDQNINQTEIFESITQNALEELFLEENARNIELFLQEYASYLAQLRGNQAKGLLATIENDMRQNYRENITLKELSQKYFINAAYLGQIFRKQFNESFKDHLNRIRSEKACDLLIKTDLRIYEIAEEVGYKDLDYFIEKFISFYGITPAKFRKQTNAK